MWVEAGEKVLVTIKIYSKRVRNLFLPDSNNAKVLNQLESKTVESKFLKKIEPETLKSKVLKSLEPKTLKSEVLKKL